MLDFDHGTLAADLAGPDDWRAATFAAACAEFLLPAYRRFADAEQVGDPDLVEDVLDRLWTGLSDRSGDGRARIADSSLPGREEILDLLPNPDEDVNDWSFCAESAIAALAEAVHLGTGEGDAASGANAGRSAYEAVDAVVSSLLDPPRMTPAIAREILGSSLAQGELRRQREAVEVLRSAEGRSAATVSELRRAARGLSATLLDEIAGRVEEVEGDD